MQKINIGVIGAGFFSQTAHIANFRKISNCNISCIADKKPKLLSSVAKKFNIEKQYNSHSELLDNEKKLDGIVVVVSRPEMPPIVYDCIKKKIPTFCEKPLCFNAIQTKKILKLQNLNKVFLQIGFMRNHDLGVIKAKKIFKNLMQKNKYGKLKNIEINAYDSNPYCNEKGYIRSYEKFKSNEWPTYPKWLLANDRKFYADFTNRFCHNINLINNFIQNEPKVIFSKIDQNLNGIAILDYKEFIVNFQTSVTKFAKRMDTLTFNFEKAKLTLDLSHALQRSPSKVNLRILDNEEKQINYFCRWSWAFENQAINFCKNIHNKTNYKFSNSFDYLKDVKLIESIWKKKYESN